MGISINTNKTVLSAIGVLRKNDRESSTITERLISGKRVNSAKDNASAYSISKGMRADVATLNTVSNSINRGISTVDVALGSGNLISDMLLELKEKSILFSNEVDTDLKKAIIGDYNSIIERINDVVENSNFAGANLLKPEIIETRVIQSVNLTHGGGSFVVGDVNQDGKQEIIAGDSSGSIVSTYNLDGTITEQNESQISNLTVSDLADVNGDGNKDILRASGSNLIIGGNESSSDLPPLGMRFGGGGDVEFTINNAGGSSNPGEVYITGDTFAHPDGTIRNLNNPSTIGSDMEPPQGAVEGFIIFSDSDPGVRFSTLNLLGDSKDFFFAKYDSGLDQWKAFDNAGTEEIFTPDSNDVIVSKVIRNSAASVGIDSIENYKNNTGVNIEVTPNGQSTSFARFGDFNGDGNKDVVRRASDSSFEVLNGDGEFNFSSDSTVVSTNITFINDIQVSDTNNNGVDDIIVSGTGGGNGFIETYSRNGNGTFVLSETINLGSSTFAGSIEVADFNEDGNSDIAALNVNGGTTTSQVHFGSGDGNFNTNVTAGTFSSATIQTSGDINNDGHVDLVVLDANNSGVSTDDSFAIIEGQGDGTFVTGTPLTSTSITQNMKGLQISDINGDNVNDLIWSDGTTPNAPSDVFVMKQEAKDFKVQISSSGVSLNISHEGMDTASLGLTKLSLNSSKSKVTKAISLAIDTVNLQMSRLASAGKRLEKIMEMNVFVQDKLTEGIGNLVDSDMAKESAKQQAMQVRKQLGNQILNVANQSPFQILSLFGIDR